MVLNLDSGTAIKPSAHKKLPNKCASFPSGRYCSDLSLSILYPSCVYFWGLINGKFTGFSHRKPQTTVLFIFAVFLMTCRASNICKTNRSLLTFVCFISLHCFFSCTWNEEFTTDATLGFGIKSFHAKLIFVPTLVVIAWVFVFQGSGEPRNPQSFCFHPGLQCFLGAVLTSLSLTFVR